MLVSGPVTWNLSTRRLRLRPASADDIDTLHSIWRDPEVRRYLWDGVEIGRDRAAAVVETGIACAAASGGGGLWLLQPHGQAGAAGFCALLPFGSPQDWEILYGLLPGFWGSGLAVEAAQAMLFHGFRTLGCRRIAGRTDPPNRASIRVLEKLGMRFAGTSVSGELPMAWYWIAKEELR